jgi:hypothetical protein
MHPHDEADTVGPLSEYETCYPAGDLLEICWIVLLFLVDIESLTDPCNSAGSDIPAL